MANQGQTMIDFWIVMLMIGAAAGIFRASFIFILGPSPYGETVSGNTVTIIICILIIGLGCFILGGGFESRPHVSRRHTNSKKAYPPKSKKTDEFVKKRERPKGTTCNPKIKSNSSTKNYKHGSEVRDMLYDTSGRYERCPNCTSLVDMEIGFCRFCGYDLIKKEYVVDKKRNSD